MFAACRGPMTPYADPCGEQHMAMVIIRVQADMRGTHHADARGVKQTSVKIIQMDGGMDIIE